MKKILSMLIGTLLVNLALLALGACQPTPAPTPHALTPTATALPPTPTAASLYREGITEDGAPFKGNPQATVTLEEFSSYQCSYCVRYFQETYPQLMETYIKTGKVRYIAHEFPLAGQPQSQPAAEAADCAARIGGGSS